MARPLRRLPAGDQLRPLFDGLADQPADGLDRVGVDQRADIGAGGLAAAGRQRAHAPAEQVGELPGHGLVHEEPVGRCAGLTHVPHLGDHGAVDGGLDVGVLEDDERRVASQLHRQPLELVGRLPHQHLAHRRRAGEADLAQPLVGHQGLAELLGVAGGHDVEHTGGKPRLGQHVGQRQHRQGGQLGRLDDHRAAGRHRRPDLAGPHRQREVPRGQEEAWAHRLADRQ